MSPSIKTEPCLPRIIALAILAVIVLLAFTGCVSSRYKSAKKDALPPLPLNLTAEQSALKATVKFVIIFHGPGSWKRDAYWDEYCVRLVNRGEIPFVLESAEIVDFRQDRSAPGDNPWRLEKQSLTRQEEINRAAKAVLVQAGSGYLAVGMAGSVMFFSGTACATASTVLFAGFLPIYAGGAIYHNISSRHDIENEFQRHRLVLPQTLAPGQTAQGSFFFRISPAPQRLVLHGRAGDTPCDVTIDLTPLGPLHIKPAGLAAKD